MSLIQITDLTFKYDDSYDYIFENVTFKIDSNWKLGFIGRNGKGKTTFLKLLMKEYEYLGSITTSLQFDYFPFIVEDQTINTLAVVDSINHDYEYWMLEKELTLLDIDSNVLDRPFNTLSNGEQVKVLLATLFLKDNNYLLIDEPTNHLDLQARSVVSNYLKRKSNYILVCHDRNFIDNCIDHVLVINKTNIEVQNGNFSSWQQNKQNQDNLEISINNKLKKDIKRLTKTAMQTATWSEKIEKSKVGNRFTSEKPYDKGYIGHKSAKMMKRSKNAEKRQFKAAEDKSKLLKNIETIDNLKITQLKYPKQLLVKFNNVSIFYDERTICSGVSFEIIQGDRICLSGKNGSGKSSILKLIIDEAISYTGEIKKGNNLIISYVAQDTSFLKGDLTAYAIKEELDISLFKTILHKLDFSSNQFEKRIETYSSGQKKKVLIAGALSKPAHLYIFDEPLNYLDVFSRIQIEDLLKTNRATIIFVEHDHIFNNTIATKIIEL